MKIKLVLECAAGFAEEAMGAVPFCDDDFATRSLPQPLQMNEPDS
jgi:hypothetical protein